MIPSVMNIVALLAVAALAVGGTSGCSKGSGEGDEGSLPGQKKQVAPRAEEAPAAPKGDGSLTGAGATFPYPLYTKWISEIGKARPGLRINYQSIGSGGGIRQITERTVDFGASDAPMSDEQLAKAQGLLHIPTCLGAVVLTYNLEGVPSGLKMTPDAVAGIFLGTVKEWTDPLIAKENPGVKLPKKTIASVHRSDGSGTTRIFTDWLSAASADWKKGPGAGTSVSFPSGLGAKGNEGVAGQVSSTPGAIGYIELAFAQQNHLSYASVKNAAGAFVTPSPASITLAGAGAAAKMPEDMRSSAVSAQGEGAYPIFGFTYILLYSKQTDAARGKALVDFLTWSIHEGQAFTEPLSYAPLPSSLVPKIDAKLAMVTGPDGKPLRAAKP
jgi:phosphate transport system substrate-binding protein